MPQSRNLPNKQLTHLTRSGPIPHPSNIKYIHIYIHAGKKTSVKGNRSLRGLNVWRNCCQLFRNRMYFLKLMAWCVLASSCSWVPLLSVFCLPLEPWLPSYPWLVRLPSPGRKILIPCPPTMLIRNTESGLRQQRQGPNFHDVFQVSCPPINAFVEEKV